MQYLMLTILAVALFAGQAFLTLTFQQKESNDEFSKHIQEKVFDDCFDYYAQVGNAEHSGIQQTTIQTCLEKTYDWMNWLRDKNVL